MKRRSFLAGAGAALFCSGAKAEIISGAEATSAIRFKRGKEEFILADVSAPPLYLLQEGDGISLRTSTKALAELLSDKVEVFDVLPKTRWKTRVVIAKSGDLTVQEKLVADGFAWVAPESENFDFIDKLLTLERSARAEERGLWADATYGIVDAGDAGRRMDRFAIVEGVVKKAAVTRSRVYLNFGEDYRTDFTATAASALYRKWLAKGLDLATLEAKRVRVRGFVAYINGPSIELTHIKQVEVLEQASG
jgi:hypothetical protein